MGVMAAGGAVGAPAALALVGLEREALAVASGAALPGGHGGGGGGKLPGAFYDVTRFGAVGNGETLNTAALQKALDACAAGGGGTVLVPPGRYLTGALFLRSNLHLHLCPGATLLASRRPQDFPPIPGRWEGIERKTHSSLLTGVEVENVAITGQGTLDGQGPPWWEAYATSRKLRLERGLPREAEEPGDSPLKFPRPRLINLIKSQVAVISGLNLREGPSWNVHLVYCQDVIVDGLTMAGLQAQDCCGIIIDSSKQVRVVNCSIASGADCIGIKSGYNEDGRRVGLPSEDIVITNCNLSFSYAAGIAIGSETAGGIKNVAISNCVINNCQNGINIRTTRGRGGVVEQVRVSNLVMDHIEKTAFVVKQFLHSVHQGIVNPNEPPPPKVTFETDRTLKPPASEGTPTFRELDFSGASIGQVFEIAQIDGLPERFINGLTIKDVTAARAKQGVTLSCARDVTISRMRLDPSEGPAVFASNVEHLEIDRLRSLSAPAKGALVRLENVADAFIHGCNVAPGPAGFVDQQSAHNRAVTLEANRLTEPRRG